MLYQQLLQSIAAIIAGYRLGQVPPPTAAHVDRWVSQFTLANRLAVLQEMEHVLRNWYFTEANFRQFISMLAVDAQLAGPDPRAFWQGTNILQTQGRGHSQGVMLQMFDECLQAACGLQVQQCGRPGGPYVYIDDALFSGGQLKEDLEAWIRGPAPAQAFVNVIVMVSYASAEYYSSKWLPRINQETGKNVQLHFWRLRICENRNYYRYSADVYWPAAVPQDQAVVDCLQAETQYPFTARHAGGGNQVFSSEVGRQVLETEFLIAGANLVRRFPANVYRRPLGYGRFGVGFGATMVTYRNCPNNAPLALWWGDDQGQAGKLGWYPLFPRDTRDQNDFRQILADFKKFAGSQVPAR